MPSSGEHLFVTGLSFAFPPFLVVVLFMVLFASIGWTFGVREQYLKLLLYFFDWGKQRIRKKSSESSHDTVENADEPNSVIRKETFFENPTKSSAALFRKKDAGQRGCNLGDIADLLRWGMGSIVEDEVTKRFAATELASWNLLTRTNQQYQFISIRLTIIWGIGFLVRYCVLLPLRTVIAVTATTSLVIGTALVGYLPAGPLKRRLNELVMVVCFRILARGFSAVIRYHNRENRPVCGSICVANHTSPIDAVVLSTDNAFAMIAQTHQGYLGLLQRALSRAASHIWFDRFEVKDREIVSRRLKEHTATPFNLPVLVFPEGTCINNTSVMMFKKGCFEIGCPVYPVAVKYDQRFGDAFWDSSKFTVLHYVFRVMTGWAIVAEVTYLPRMERLTNETTVQFANRVKQAICLAGGLVDLDWDGQLKRQQAKPEWKAAQQKHYSERLKSD